MELREARLRDHQRGVTRLADGKPAPGSDEAVVLGCICPVLDNSHGLGWHQNGEAFWRTEGCPVHG